MQNKLNRDNRTGVAKVVKKFEKRESTDSCCRFHTNSIFNTAVMEQFFCMQKPPRFRYGLRVNTGTIPLRTKSDVSFWMVLFDRTADFEHTSGQSAFV